MFAELIFPFALPQVFTYAVPDEFQAELKPGMRVAVQFGARRMYSALVLNIHFNPPSDYETKPILAVLDSYPVVTPEQFDFWKWLSTYYLCTLGEVMKAALPAGLKLESETRLLINPDFEKYETISEKESAVLTVLEEKNSLTISEIAKVYNKRDLLGIIKSLIDKEAVFAEEHLREGYKPKLITHVRLNTEFLSDEKMNAVLDSLKRAPKQLLLLQFFLQLNAFEEAKNSEFEKRELIKSSGSTADALQALVKKGIFGLTVREISPKSVSEFTPDDLKPLNEPQQKAKEEIKQYIDKKGIVLLHGVTSSGKTEIYFHLIAEEIAKNNQVLYLLPEIALTAQMINRLTETFGNCVGIYHSKYSDT
ncbi:MAG: DEAD/DEAH box helicase family protein, partial [Bacteroidales bacterium]|nr:DEAD/DEAH box helicase family protein [Bacteroidales bacterium]